MTALPEEVTSSMEEVTSSMEEVTSSMEEVTSPQTNVTSSPLLAALVPHRVPEMLPTAPEQFDHGGSHNVHKLTEWFSGVAGLAGICLLLGIVNILIYIIAKKKLKGFWKNSNHVTPSGGNNEKIPNKVVVARMPPPLAHHMKTHNINRKERRSHDQRAKRLHDIKVRY